MRDGGRKWTESSEERDLFFWWRRGPDIAKKQTKRRGEGPAGEEDGGVPCRTVLDGGGNADAVKHIVGNKPDVKLSGLGLSDEGVAALGEDQSVDTGGDEIVEQMAYILGRGRRGDGGLQDATIVGDDGGEPLDTLP